jgi:adenylate cyclase
MKRSTAAALIIGAVVSALIIAAHATRLMLPLEQAVARVVVGERPVNTQVAAVLQYLLVVVIAVGSAWLVLTTARRRRLHWPVAAIAVQLITVAWVCLLYQVFFQPLPSLFALVLGFATAHGYVSTRGRSRSVLTREFFAGRLSDEQRARISSGEVAFEPTAKSYEVTAVVCDIANKHDLAEECLPGELTEITEKFLAHATHSFLEAGAYLDTVAGEGIVALFGFPGEDQDQAEKATRHALQLLKSFEQRRENGRDAAFGKFDVHVGISSGTMTLAPVQLDGRSMLLATGEPVELARRFCIANRFYGSRILIGPKTFELTSKMILARPIDFLSGVDSRERHEIYEPLKLAADATPEEVARRDSFWSGVVFYREKRWGEAYTQFQQARGPGDREDAPLQLYLRRIEPLALHLAIADDS